MKIPFFFLTLFNIGLVLAQNANGEYEVIENETTQATSDRFSVSATDGYDVTIPEDIPFNTGDQIEGHIQNSVNLATGKVVFNIPVATISANRVSFPIALLYNGQISFEQGRQQNKYSPVSPVGVGWSMEIPKIIADHNNTGAIDDDTFYLISNGSSVKLLNEGNFNFRPEIYSPIKVTYDQFADTWTIIDENATIYTYDKNSYISTWQGGNWVGSTSVSADARFTREWKLGKIEDHWNGNSLSFVYDEIMGKNNSSQPSYADHTEASYVKEIISSRGGKVIFNYGTKNIGEYFEPHTEMAEPDAYQEFYEKKYLDNIEIFDRENNFKYLFDLEHTIQDLDSQNKKRYLTRITKKDSQFNPLPPQEFEYFYNGDFKGGLQKITYPSGGSVTYNYENKYQFYNGYNRFETAPPNLSQDYNLAGSYSGNNFALKLYMSKTLYSGNKRKFRVLRFWWNGQKWNHDLYDFMQAGRDLFEIETVGGTERPKNMLAVFNENFYGIVKYENDDADLHMFHLNKDGKTWDLYQDLNLDIGPGKPRFMNGLEYVSIGSHHNGKLINYFWNGIDWGKRTIFQGSGQYYYGAGINFILAMDEDGGIDMGDGQTYNDNYYFHYLDSERKWVTHSWSSILDPHLNGIEHPSYFYPGTTMAGFVQDDDNPEKIIKWNKLYAVTGVDSPYGWYDSSSPIFPTFNNNFTLTSYNKNPKKTVRFNGSIWNVKEITPSFSTTISENMVLTHEGTGTEKFYYWLYNPNTDNWSKTYLDYYDQTNYYKAIAGLTPDFGITGNKLYTRNTLGALHTPVTIEGSYDSKFVYSNNYNHILAQFYNGGLNFSHSKLYYKNKRNGNIENINLNSKSHLFGLFGGSFGGWYPFLSTNSMWLRDNYGMSSFSTYLYRIIDDRINEDVYDIVVDNILIDNNKGNIREMDYAYSNPNSLPDQSITYYGEVISKNKGLGSGNIGYTKNFYNIGDIDIRKAGILEKQEIRDANNNLESESIYNWDILQTGLSHNGQYAIAPAYYARLMSTTNKQFMDNGDQLDEMITANTYNSLGLKTGQYSTNSLGETESQEIFYAYQQYSFVNDNNLLTAPYEVINKINGQVVSISRTVWEEKTSVSAVYPYEEWIQTNASSFRRISQISEIDDNGNILETNNGEGIYSTTLYGMQHRYPVAQIKNARFNDVVAELDYSYAQLQDISAGLKSALSVLYDRIPSAMVSISLFDSEGRTILEMDNRKDEINYIYDSFGRLLKITNKDGNILEEKTYNFGSD
ncbi:hypothetical protein POV27_14870 [Aureisphaera galaxeae]|uniref:hypothetical protein n=1 Tax=Aureisphaera galaxeae TaxID=1538023 RepID=UPI0023507259|nr:hypothetical protein [Aureisphaera galaxeae]MDC8005343.1 hypothetical protein [Aureisphaera galaxeae]